MKPQDDTCHNCKKFSSHHIINGHYVCPNCGLSTRIMSWDEAQKRLERIKLYWKNLELEGSEFFCKKHMIRIDALLKEVDIRNKPLLN